MSETFGSQPFGAGYRQPDEQDLSADEIGLDDGGLDTGAEDIEALDYSQADDLEAQADDGPNVPSTTDDRLAERLDPNRHHAGQPEGLATPLQPGGLTPGGGPAAGMQGAVGTGGGQTGGSDTGDVASGGV
ncbi:hypothetical protein [Phenylobacterium deserti]|uniref:Uncharacterized protein n=1 Tax=Phenylobacterium deserti TaxID=1914756 RepID=A0A328APL8_9CAUL|nr:hypothetical protein [Phenylobacterium deserti]RAK56952.1 hypothetical protein DJ018_03005 [Phenylobacterium deserti]